MKLQPQVPTCTCLLQPCKACCHNTAEPWLSQNQQLGFSPTTLSFVSPLGTASASPTAVAITKASGIFFYYLISAREPLAGRCPHGRGTSILSAQSLLPWYCRNTKTEEVGPLQYLNISRNRNLAFMWQGEHLQGLHVHRPQLGGRLCPPAPRFLQ